MNFLTSFSSTSFASLHVLRMSLVMQKKMKQLCGLELMQSCSLDRLVQRDSTRKRPLSASDGLRWLHKRSLGKL